ncbi:phage tail protein [Sedimentitalea sp.]|uniref:phage tail protein n=1 Tax=Sedimentitalea sp. TaxID=2048915 RepID=UPI003298CC1E
MKDANGISFQLLLGPEDWEAAVAAEGATGDTGDIVWDGRQGAVLLAAEIKTFPPRSGAVVLGPEDRRGADVDCFGNWYWIDSDARAIQTWRPGQTASEFWHADLLDQQPCPPTDGSFADSAPAEPAFADVRLSGLAVTARHNLIVGTQAPNGLLVFDLHGSGPPVFRRWSDDMDIDVFDMTPAQNSATWLLDRGNTANPAMLWQLDARLCLTSFAGEQTLPAPPRADFFNKETGPEPVIAQSRPLGLDLSVSSAGGLAGATDAVAVAGLPDNTVLVLDAPVGLPSRILRYGSDGLLSAVVLDALLLDKFETPPAALQGHDVAFVTNPATAPGRIDGTLLLVDVQGDQALRFDVTSGAFVEGGTGDYTLSMALSDDYIPLRRFEGRGIVTNAGGVYYDIGETWVELTAHPRRRRRTEGSFRTPLFDATQPGTHWHRCILDGCIPPGTSTTISIRAADDPAMLAGLVFEPLPTPYRRGEGSEIPFWDPYPGSDPARATGTFETLVQSARGRFAQLEITLTGDGSVTPKIRALRLYAPRFSYLEHYLPAAYREDRVSASFLDRFLSNVEGLFTSMENRVADAYGLWDTRTVPAEALDWLAGWLGATLEPGWDATRKRLFVENAELLFRWRGTPAGLKALIDIATAPCPDATLFDSLRSGQPLEPDNARRGVRLSEDYTRRTRLAASAETSDLLTGWTTDDNSGAVHIAFEAFALARRGTDLAGLAAAWARPLVAGAVQFSPLLPASDGEREDWLAFTDGPIGFRYAAATRDSAPAWQSFLARRYAAPDRIASAHGLTGPGVSPYDLPVTLPTAGAYLKDWIDFVSEVLPEAQGAHRFVVLAPVDPGEDANTRDSRIAEIARVVEHERPAHTAFEVRPFWSLFQTGIARLGVDTTLGEGARFTAIALGRSALGEGFVGYGHPYSVTDRTVVGRNAAGEVRL